jgi:hypothetical protein
MPIGHNLTRWLTCLTEFICGDCIETECRECQCKRFGHLDVAGLDICGRCGKPFTLYPRTPPPDLLRAVVTVDYAGKVKVKNESGDKELKLKVSKMSDGRVIVSFEVPQPASLLSVTGG